jgi:transcriptional regulator with XRE-family HTH domain
LTDDDAMTGGELQTIREYLGLTGEQLAALLEVTPRTVRAWEAGTVPIPTARREGRVPVREAVERLEAYTATAVDDLVAALSDARDPAVVVYRTDADMHAARPDTAHLPARWWRHVVARAAEQVPGVAIGTRTELED